MVRHGTLGSSLPVSANVFRRLQDDFFSDKEVSVQVPVSLLSHADLHCFSTLSRIKGCKERLVVAGRVKHKSVWSATNGHVDLLFSLETMTVCSFPFISLIALPTLSHSGSVINS